MNLRLSGNEMFSLLVSRLAAIFPSWGFNITTNEVNKCLQTHAQTVRRGGEETETTLCATQN